METRQAARNQDEERKHAAVAPQPPTPRPSCRKTGRETGEMNRPDRRDDERDERRGEPTGKQDIATHTARMR